MQIAFFINRLNSHQAPIADALYSASNGDFVFFELNPPTEQSSKGSTQDYSTRPYLVQAWKEDSLRKMAFKAAIDADVAIFGAESLELEVYRSKNTSKLSFELSERWLKRGMLNLLSPRLLKYQWYYHTLFYKRPLYKLCAGAYVANDQYFMKSFRQRCYKWGYFPDFSYTIDYPNSDFSSPLRFMWCARMIKLKHPELVIELADRLRSRGLEFCIDFYGDGPELERLVTSVNKKQLQSYISFKGFLPNEIILDEMKKHDVLLFTSDRKEGWGAVVNEAMGNGCVVISSDKAGCARFLIDNHKNGCVFKSGSIDSLENEVLWLYSHQGLILEMKRNAVKTICDFWNPTVAAQSLMALIAALKAKSENPIQYGPASIAKPMV